MNARVHSVETFGLVDGPGVRFILFLHGCPFRCQFCHNPDTWASQKFEEWTPQQALNIKYTLVMSLMIFSKDLV